MAEAWTFNLKNFLETLFGDLLSILLLKHRAYVVKNP